MRSFILLLFFIISFQVFSQTGMEDLYGFGDFDEESEFFYLGRLTAADGLINLLRNQQTGHLDFEDLSEFLGYANDETLFGTCFRDTIMVFVAWNFDSEFMDFLESEKNEQNSEMIDYMMDVRQKKESLLFHHFNFSTMPIRYDCPMNISMLLPSTDWYLHKTNENNQSLIAGDDFYAGIITFADHPFDGDFEQFIQNGNEEYRTFHFPNNPTEPPQSLPSPQWISNSNLPSFLNSDYDQVYEQIFYAHDEGQNQKYIQRRRFYIKEDRCIVVSINGILNSNHVLANERRLITKYGLILDSIFF